MLNFSLIDKSYSIYKNKKVVIFGVGKAGKAAYNALKSRDIDVCYFCDNNAEKWGGECYGKKIISPIELKKYYSDEYIIQIASVYENEIHEKLSQMGINNVIQYSEFYFMMYGVLDNFHSQEFRNSYWDAIKKADVEKIKLNAIMSIKQCDDYFYNTKKRLILIAPPKTGNTTIEASCYACGIPIVITGHTLKWINKFVKDNCEHKYTKIIIGVREPIEQTLSLMFYSHALFALDDDFVAENDAVQKIFDKYFVDEVLGKSISEENILKEYLSYSGRSYNELTFFDEQIKEYLGVDVYEYQFDKIKGYTIIKTKDNVEILIYQLEKLRQLSDVIGSYINVDNFRLIDKNKANEYWYYPYYKDAVRNIRLKKEYVDCLYNSKFMKHFYSEKDIDEFYLRWSDRII